MAIAIENAQSTNTTIADTITVHNFLVPTENELGDPIVDPALFVVVHGRGIGLSINSVAYGQDEMLLVNGITYNTVGVWIYYLVNPTAGIANITVNMGGQCDSLGLRVYVASGVNIADLINQTRVGSGTGNLPGDRLKLTINNWYLGGLTTFEPINNLVKISSLIDMDMARVVDASNNNAIMYVCGHLISPSSANTDIEWTLTGNVDYAFCIVDVNYGV